MSRRLSFPVPVVAAAVLFACGPPQEGLPPGLLGTWETGAPQYEDRYLELRSDSVIFGTGRYKLQMFPLEGVETEPGPQGTTHYTVYHLASDDQLSTLEFDYSVGPPATLRLSNRNFLWHKKPEAEGS